MIARILWSFVLVTTLYVVAVFARPADADKLGEALGILPLNAVLREVKEGGSQDVRVSLDAGSGGYLQDFQSTVDSARTAVESTRATIETKVQQTKKVAESVEKTAGAIEELRSNVSELTTLSGSNGSGSTASGSVTASGGASSGSGTAQKIR